MELTVDHWSVSFGRDLPEYAREDIAEVFASWPDWALKEILGGIQDLLDMPRENRREIAAMVQKEAKLWDKNPALAYRNLQQELTRRGDVRAIRKMKKAS
jgi:hypothetical protein